MKKHIMTLEIRLLPDMLEHFLVGQVSGFGAVDVRGAPGHVGAVFGGSNVRIWGLVDDEQVFKERLLRFLWITPLLPISILKCDRKRKDS